MTEVGKFYRVPCIKGAGSKYDGIFSDEWIPVVGPEHSDAEIIGFPYRHWHVDWRFASGRVFERAKRQHFTRNGDSDVFNYVLQRYASLGSGREDLDNPFVATGEVVQRRVKCRRELPAYPHQRAAWMPKLEEKFATACMKHMVCPHRGIPLDGCPRDGDVVTCPGHGLRWNVKTGALKRLAPQNGGK